MDKKKKSGKRKVQVDIDVYISRRRRSRQFKGFRGLFFSSLFFFFNLQTTEG